ncbi:MAG: porin [Schleiferiaceae bacterium]|nr:porin [Schleiferiaceae bacterium]
MRLCTLMAALAVPLAAWAQDWEDDMTSSVQNYQLGEGWSYQSGPFTGEITALVQPHLEWKYGPSEVFSDATVRTRLRRARVRFAGDHRDSRFYYRLTLDLSGSSELDDAEGIMLFQSFVGYRLTPQHRITLGQRGNPAGPREMQMNSGTLQLVERSRVSSAFATIAEMGIFYDGRVRLTGKQFLRPAVAITTGDGANPFGRDYGGLKYAARLDWVPNGLFTRFGQFRQADLVRERTPKLIVGAYANFNQGMSSRRGREQGAILYLDANLDPLLPNYAQVGVDGMLKYRGFSLLAEWIQAQAYVPEGIAYRVRTDGSVASTFEIDGVNDVSAYVRNRMMNGSGFNVQAGYVLPSNWSVDVRATQLNPADFSFLRNGAFYDRPQYYTVGLTRYASRWYGLKHQLSATWNAVGPDARNHENSFLTAPEWTVRWCTTFML